MRNHVFGRLPSALFVLALAASFPRNAAAADVPITEEARTHFAAGVVLLKDPKEPRYEEAYREFKVAYAASPSYKILGNLGLCAMKIERDLEAIDAYEKYLAQAGPELPEAERAQIQRDLLTLKAGVVRVTVSSDPPGATITDLRTPIQGDEVRNLYGEVLAPLSLGLRPGHHTITARLPGYVDQHWEFEAAGKELPAHVFTMVKPTVATHEPVYVRPIPTVAYVTGAASLVFAVTGAVVGIKALQQHDDFNKLNDGTHVADATSTRNTGQTLNIVSDAFFGGAIVAAGVTAYFILTRPTVERAGPPAPSATSTQHGLRAARFAPTWGRNGGGLTAIWDF
jgi:hypothetical protein